MTTNIFPLVQHSRIIATVSKRIGWARPIFEDEPVCTSTWLFDGKNTGRSNVDAWPRAKFDGRAQLEKINAGCHWYKIGPDQQLKIVREF